MCLEGGAGVGHRQYVEISQGKYSTGNCHEERRILQSFVASICAFLAVAL